MESTITGLGVQRTVCRAETASPMTVHRRSRRPATTPRRAIAAAVARYSNWGRWGDDDVLGTLNFLDDAKRLEGARTVRRGAVFSLTQSFDADGPQKGWRRRTNPVHTMLDTGLDAECGNQGFPHGIGGADDVISMPLQASTQWDGLGHIFDHGKAWNGRSAGDVVTSEGDRVTGIETVGGRLTGRGVLLDVGRAPRHRRRAPGRLRDHHRRISSPPSPPRARRRRSAAATSCCVRTGRLARARREGWGDYAGGPRPGLSFTTAGWLHDTEIAGDRHRHLGIRGPPERVHESPSSRCTRSRSRTWDCSSARCGTSTRSPPTARRTAPTSSSSPRHRSR